MSIEQTKKIQELEQRIEQLERICHAHTEAIMNIAQKQHYEEQTSKTLTLPEKRKSA